MLIYVNFNSRLNNFNFLPACAWQQVPVYLTLDLNLNLPLNGASSEADCHNLWYHYQRDPQSVQLETKILSYSSLDLE